VPGKRESPAEFRRIFVLLPAEQPGLTVQALLVKAQLTPKRRAAVSARLYHLRDLGAVTGIAPGGHRAFFWVRVWSPEQYDQTMNARAEELAAARRARRALLDTRPCDDSDNQYDYAGACREVSSLASMVEAQIARLERR
jgi:hypothetical protein